MKTIIALTALLACNVIGSAALVTVRNLPKRDPGQVNNLPSNDKDCKGDVFTPDDIEAAIKVAWQARKDGKFGKDGYSTLFEMSWTDWLLSSTLAKAGIQSGPV